MGIDRNRFVRKHSEEDELDQFDVTEQVSAGLVVTPLASQPVPDAEQEEVPFIPAQDNHADENVIQLKDSSSEAGPKPRRALRVAAGTLGLVLLFGLSVGAGAYSNYRDAKKAQKTVQNVLPAGQAQQTAQHATNSGGLNVVLSSGANAQQSGVLGDSTSAYYQYEDTLNGGRLNISRQPLPDNFKADPDNALKKLATELKANQTISTSLWGTVYLLTDSKGSAQVLVFKNATKLVVIQSFALHTVEEWKQYIERLEV